MCAIAALYVPTFPSEGVTFSPATFKEYLCNLVDRQATDLDVAIIVSEHDGVLTAAFAGGVILFPVTGERVAVKLNWGALPSHPGHGVAVLRAAEKWARERGATRLSASVFGEKAIKLMGDLGYSPTELIVEKVF